MDRLDEHFLDRYEDWVKADKLANTSEDATEADTATIQLPQLLEEPPPPEEIEFVIQELTNNKQDQITSITAPLNNIEIPPNPHSPPPDCKWQYYLCLVQVNTKTIQS